MCEKVVIFKGAAEVMLAERGDGEIRSKREDRSQEELYIARKRPDGRATNRVLRYEASKSRGRPNNEKSLAVSRHTNGAASCLGRPRRRGNVRRAR